MIKYFLVLFFLLNTLYSVGQIKGIVLDSATQQGVDKALIALLNKNAIKDTLYTVSNENGAFSFADVPKNEFTILVSSVGYQTIARHYKGVAATTVFDAGKFLLAKRIKVLDEVNVVADPIVVKEDTVEYRADAFKVKENATTEDLLKKLPGITVDKDGNVKAQGKDVNKIRVNGKDFFGGDVKTATRELPANIIDKVQVIDDYGDQATVSGIKDGDPQKIINLQIKKDKNKGLFGRVTAGAGKEDRYIGSINANYFNNQQQVSVFANTNNINQSLFNFGNFNMNRGMGSMMRMGQGMMSEMGSGSGLTNAFQNGDQSFVTGNGQANSGGIAATNSIGFNYRDNWGKRINAYGSYSYGHRNSYAQQTTASQNFFQDNSFLNKQNNQTTTQGDNHRLFLNIEYQIDSFHYLKISPTVTYATNYTNNNTLFEIAPLSGSKTSDGNTRILSNSTTPNFSTSILFNRRFRKKGRNFSANLSLGSSYANSEQNTNNITNDFNTPPLSFSRNQQLNQLNDNYNYGIRLTYSEPLSKSRNLDITASHNLNYARNNKNTYAVDTLTGALTYLSFLSNDFDNDFYSNRLGVSVRSTYKKYNFTLGISAQPVSLQGRSVTKDSAYKSINRVNVFPIARFNYNFSRSKTFTANYSGNATQPTFNQLQEVPDISNPQYLTVGNAVLKPAINHTLNLSYNNFNFMSGKVLFTSLVLSAIDNQIVNNRINSGNGVTLSIPQNVDGFYNVLGFYTFSKPFKKRKYILTLTGTVNYNHNVNLIDSIRNIGQNWVASQGVTLEFNYKNWLQWGGGINYSVNAVRYTTPKGSSTISTLQNASSNALTLSSNINIDLPKNWVLTYDIDYTINNGLSSTVGGNLAIFNASIEKQLFKKKNGILKLSAYDIFNQNTNIMRSVSANTIVDSRSLRLARFFMFTFTFRLQKFKGQRPKTPSMNRMNMPEQNTEIRMF
ncbi:MAG: outer membrane beta-barrel protein [Ferruginibacter sp.]